LFANEKPGDAGLFVERILQSHHLAQQGFLEPVAAKAIAGFFGYRRQTSVTVYLLLQSSTAQIDTLSAATTRVAPLKGDQNANESQYRNH
jgi:hypothetical protein